MKTFNEIMKIRDEPDNKPEVTKRKFRVKKTNNENNLIYSHPHNRAIMGWRSHNYI